MDFSNTSFTIKIPASDDQAGTVSQNVDRNATHFTFNITDDHVNEIEQSFALVAILDDVPEEFFACFQRSGADACHGKIGATEVNIMDNDGKLCNYIN